MIIYSMLHLDAVFKTDSMHFCATSEPTLQKHNCTLYNQIAHCNKCKTVLFWAPYVVLYSSLCPVHTHCNIFCLHLHEFTKVYHHIKIWRCACPHWNALLLYMASFFILIMNMAVSISPYNHEALQLRLSLSLCTLTTDCTLQLLSLHHLSAVDVWRPGELPTLLGGFPFLRVSRYAKNAFLVDHPLLATPLDECLQNCRSQESSFSNGFVIAIR